MKQQQEQKPMSIEAEMVGGLLCIALSFAVIVGMVWVVLIAFRIAASLL